MIYKSKNKTRKGIRHLFLLLLLLLFLPLSQLNALEWPQKVSSLEDLFSLFAQNLGDTFSCGLVFMQKDTVTAADSGKYLINLKESTDTNWFDSPLGNAIVVVDKEQMMSVYANLQEIYISPRIDNISNHTALGMSGKSGWQKESAGLEYHVLDVKNKTQINPMVLLPRIENKNAPIIRTIIAKNKNGTSYDLNQVKTLPSGYYSLYRDLPGQNAPFTIVVSINGQETEKMSYDVLRSLDNRLYISGKTNYPHEVVYPDLRLQLLANTTLSRGRNVITIIITDVQQNEKSVSFTIDVQ